MAKTTILIKKGLLEAKLIDNDDVKNFLKQLPEAFKRKFLISILKKNSKPFINAAKQNLTSSVKGESSGYLANSIGFKVKRTGNKNLVYLGVRPNVKKKYKKQVKGNSEIRTAAYAVGIEYGFKKYKAGGYGYMRKAYESQKGIVEKNLIDDAKNVIERTQRRYLKNGKYVK